MKKYANALRPAIVVLALISVMAVDVQSGLASEVGNYPGKWYGWWCPTVPRTPPVDTPLPQGENQKIIKSWGYQTGISFDEIKHLFPGESFYEVCLKNPEVWGNFRINETAHLPYDNKRLIEATEKYKGTAYIDEKGHIQNYKAGCPFPGTKNPVEMAWNYVAQHFLGGDIDLNPWVRAIVDKKGHSRWAAGKDITFYYKNRFFMDPKPVYTPNPKNYESLHTFGYDSPYDMKVTVPLWYRYDDPDKQDAMWMYLPSMRRVRRMSVAQRWDRVPGGADIWWDTFSMFSGKPTNYEWKYLGRKELLVSRISSIEPQMLKNKLLGACDHYWERINCEVLEARPKITSPISRMVMYCDPETYYPFWAIYYDKKGREWVYYFFSRSCDINWLWQQTNMIHIDVQRTHSSNVFVYGTVKNSEDITPEFFAMDNLKRYFGGR